MSGLARLIALFANPLARALTELKRRAGGWCAPKDCQLRGFWERGPNKGAKQSQRGLWELNKDGERVMVITTNPDNAVQDRFGNPVCIWRKQWPDNGRKSKRYARA
jgi:hypothetical protein